MALKYTGTNMDLNTYKLRLENLQLKLQQAPTQANILQYLEARIVLLEEYAHGLENTLKAAKYSTPITSEIQKK